MKSRKRLYDFDYETEEGMKERDNEPLEETDEENELRPRSPIKETKKDTKEKQHRFLGIIMRSTRTFIGMQSLRFREV